MATPRDLLWHRDHHTEAKHRLLDRYLQAWFPIIAAAPLGAVDHFTYVDAFAGPGEYTNSEESSPVIAVRNALRGEVTMHGRRNLLVFMEERQDRVAHLRTVLAERFPERNRPSSVVVVPPEKGSCETDLLPLLDRVGAWGGPIFANLDGWGVDTPFALIQRIGLEGSAEVLVTFQDQWFTRFAEQHEVGAGDRVFGDTAWRAVADLGSPEEKRSFLVSEYRRRLDTAGFPYTLTFELIDEGGHALFLVFGTSSIEGVTKMKDALWVVDPIGGSRFRDPRDPMQLSFSIDEPDFTPLRRVMLEELEIRGETDLRSLCNHALEQTIYRVEHVLPAIKALVESDKVEQVKTGSAYRDKTFRAKAQGSLFG